MLLYNLIILLILLLICTYYDLKFLHIPEKLVLVFFVFGIILNFYTISNSLLAGIFALLFFALIKFISDKLSKLESMGYMDQYLAATVGVYIGYPMIFIFINRVFIIGGLTALFIVLTKRKQKYKELPLAPFFLLSLLTLFIY